VKRNCKMHNSVNLYTSDSQAKEASLIKCRCRGKCVSERYRGKCVSKSRGDVKQTSSCDLALSCLSYFLQALHTVPAQTVYRPSDCLLTTIINIIYAHACLCVAWYMRALFMLARRVGVNMRG